MCLAISEERPIKFDMPKAVLSGLALIAAAIYFGPGSSRVNAALQLSNVKKPIPVVICNAPLLQKKFTDQQNDNGDCAFLVGGRFLTNDRRN